MINIFKGRFLNRNMKKSVNINFNLSNRAVYTLITFLVLSVVGVGVYAIAGTTPNPGHAFTELQPCTTAGEILKSDGTTWTCGVDDSGSGSLWTPSSSGSDIYYNNGNVGIGTVNPTYTLDVTGNAGFTKGIRPAVHISGTAVTHNAIFDALSPLIPNVGDEIIVSGGIYRSGYFYQVMKVTRDTTTTIRYFFLRPFDGAIGSFAIIDGSVAALGISLTGKK